MNYKKIYSFDKSYSEIINIINPSSYKDLENKTNESRNFITIGSNLSYVPAAFGKNIVSISTSAFNKILYFNEKEKIIIVESGLKIYELLNFTFKYKLWIPQIPGYPLITIGGAVAANVHGKNASIFGSISNSVIGLKIFHKDHGWLNLSNEKNKEIFDLTIGGFGLTGTIIAITLKLEEIKNFFFETTTEDVMSVKESAEKINICNRENFLYSLNFFSLNKKNNSKGLLFREKSIEFRNILNTEIIFKTQKKFQISIWNQYSIKLLNRFLLYYFKFKKKKIKTIYSVLFPFYGKESYFSFFGKQGFLESQILIDFKKVDIFLEEFENLAIFFKPSIVFFSVKRNSGEHLYLRFEGNKINIAFDLVKNKNSILFLNSLYKVYIKLNVIPSIIKDSNLDLETFNKTYIYADQFRSKLRNFDPKRVYKSELSNRLKL